MKNIMPIRFLRDTNWSTIPKTSGYYRWYFPEESLKQLGFTALIPMNELKLPHIEYKEMGVYYGLYFGIAKSLKQRIKWHSAQSLKPSALSSGFLSTFRFSLLALLNIDYNIGGEQELNHFMDQLLFEWQETDSKEEAEAIEKAELQGELSYPINLQGNQTPHAQAFVRNLKQKRKQYKTQWL